jgi:hypothetical protein
MMKNHKAPTVKMYGPTYTDRDLLIVLINALNKMYKRKKQSCISFLWFANTCTTSLLQPVDQGTIAKFKAY